MKKNSIKKNFIYSLIYQLLIILLPLITTPYLSRVLQAESIGIFGYTLSIVTYFVMLGSLGVSMYGQREIAYHQNDKKRASKVFYELFILRFISLLIAILFFYLIYGRVGTYAPYYRILIIQLVASMLDINWFFQGLEEFDKTVIRNLVVKVLSLFLIFTLVKKPEDLGLYMLIYVGAELIGNLSMIFYLPKYLVRVPFKELEIKKIIKPVILLFLPQIAIQIYTVLDKTMIGFITSDMVEVGYYEQAQKVVRAAMLVLAALQSVMNSRIANAYHEHDEKEIKSCLEKSFDFVWLLSIPMVLGFIAIVSKLVPWYYGNGFDGVTNIIIATAPILIAIGLNGITGVQYLVQTGRQNVFTASVIVGALVNVLLNIILIHYYKGVGAAIASVLAETTILAIQLHYFKGQFRLRDILKRSIKCVLSGIVMFVVVAFVTNQLSVSIMNTLIEVVIGISVYIAMLSLLRYQFLKDIWNPIKQSIGVKLKRGGHHANH